MTKKQPTTRATIPASAKAARPMLARDHFTDDLSSLTGLAQLIASVLNHPRVTVHIYNKLSEAISDLQTEDALHDAACIERILFHANDDN